MERPVVLVAAGGLPREALEVARMMGRPVVGLLDDDPARHGTTVAGLPVLGPVEAGADHPDVDLVACAGRGVARAAIVERLATAGVGPERFASLVHPASTVPPGCTVGRGTVVLAGVVLTADVTVGDHVAVMPHATLTHDDVVADFATLAAGVRLAGDVRVGRSAYVGTNASVRERTRIGAGATIGMGAVVLGDVPDGQTWVGVPARRLVRDSAPVTGHEKSAPGLLSGAGTTSPHMTAGPDRTVEGWAASPWWTCGRSTRRSRTRSASVWRRCLRTPR